MWDVVVAGQSSNGWIVILPLLVRPALHRRPRGRSSDVIPGGMLAVETLLLAPSNSHLLPSRSRGHGTFQFLYCQRLATAQEAFIYPRLLRGEYRKLLGLHPAFLGCLHGEGSSRKAYVAYQAWLDIVWGEW